MTEARRGRRLPLAIATLAIVLIAIVSIVAGRSFDGDGIAPIDDVDLLHGPIDGRRSSVEAATEFALGWLEPTTDVSDTELRARFSRSFLDALPVDELRAGRTELLSHGPYAVRGVFERRADSMFVSLTGRDGPYVLAVVMDSDEPSRIGGVSVTVIDPVSDPMTTRQLLLAIVAAAALAIGAVAAARRRHDVLSLAAAGTSVLAIAQLGQLSSNRLVFCAGLAAGPAALGIGGLVLGPALVRGTPRSGRIGPALAVVATAFGTAPLWMIGTRALGLPGTPFAGADIGTVRALADGRAAVATALAIALGGLAIGTIRHQARLRAPALAVLAASVMTVLWSLGWFVGGGRLDLTLSAWGDGVLLLLAAGLALFTFPPAERAGVAQLVIDLGEDTGARTLEASLGAALQDPSAELVYWSEELGAYVSGDGRRRALDDFGPDRRTRAITAHGAPLAVLVHDAALEIDPARVAAICAAARLALEVERLRAEAGARLLEVEASRSRIVQAADEARRRVERDLHDGAQQRLLAVLLGLRRVQHSEAGRPVADELDTVSGELAAAIEELRTIGRGLRPPVLDHGLTVALGSLAESAPLPVEVTVPPGIGSFGEAIDSAVWFVVSEAITNAARHADATVVQVTLTTGLGTIMVEIVDDGRGGADAEHGSGLQRLRDRAEALGGSVTVTSPPGHGTTVRLVLPSPAGSGAVG